MVEDEFEQDMGVTREATSRLRPVTWCGGGTIVVAKTAQPQQGEKRRVWFVFVWSGASAMSRCLDVFHVLAGEGEVTSLSQ